MAFGPSGTAKIAGVAALAGIMLAVVVAGLREPDEPPLEMVLPVLEESEQQKLLVRELERCATLTLPDRGCEAAWAENRKRFFGKEGAAPEPDIGNDGDGPDAQNGAGSTTP